MNTRRSHSVRVLAGDIGGTKTRLAVVEVAGARVHSVVEATYRSAAHASLEAILTVFFSDHPASVQAACFGIAGPVRDGRARTTNLPWRVQADALAKRFSIDRVFLLNDLEANAWGIQALGPEDLHTLHEGDPDPEGNAAVIAAGTGLGEAGICRDRGGWHPFATEGGHADFAPGSDLEIALLRFLRARHGHVSWERVLSGPGLVAIHAFLREERAVPMPQWLEEEMRIGDGAAAISRAAQEGRDGLCAEALGLFVRLYGAEAGNLALKHMATGGLYLGGGIAPKILGALQDDGFIQAFLDKGRMRPLLERVPVQVILNDRTALYGPAVYAARRLEATRS